MAVYSIKSSHANGKLWCLTLYLYVAPLIGSVLVVMQYGHLLGDFSRVALDPSPEKLLLTAVVYLIPLAVIVVALRLSSGMDKWSSHQNYSKFLFYVLLCVALLTLLFGAIPVGAPPAPGISGVVQTIVLKFNPYLVFLLLAALRVPPRQIAIGALCVLTMSLSQKSLLGGFVIATALSLYWVDNKVRSRWQLLFFFTIPFVITAGLQDVIAYLYDLRNESRGGAAEIPEDLVLSYALGRINSFSSLYQILYDDCCGFAPSRFYVVGTFLERLTGLSVFSSTTPDQTYNDFILGVGREYGIFVGTAGTTFILLKNGWFIFIANVVAILVFLKLMYILVPIPAGPRKLPLFLIVLYLPYLSGDVWELSLIFQSIVVLRIAHWLLIVFMKSLRRLIGVWKVSQRAMDSR